MRGSQFQSLRTVTNKTNAALGSNQQVGSLGEGTVCPMPVLPLRVAVALPTQLISLYGAVRGRFRGARGGGTIGVAVGGGVGGAVLFKCSNAPFLYPLGSENVLFPAIALKFPLLVMPPVAGFTHSKLKLFCRELCVKGAMA